MNRKQTLCLVVGILLACSFADASPVSVSVVPSVASLAAGDPLTVSLYANIPDPVVAWGLNFDWNSSVLQFLSFQVGLAWLPFDSSDGHYLAGLAFPGSISGSNVLLGTLNFAGISGGNSALTASYDPADPSTGFALDPEGFAAANIQNSQVTVTGTTSSGMIINGSFEDPHIPDADICHSNGATFGYAPCGSVVGWAGNFQLTSQGSPFDMTTPFPDGNQILLLQSVFGFISTASQDIDFPAAGVYQLTWMDSNRPAYGQQQYFVQLDGSTLQTYTPADSWAPESLLITAPQGVHTLSFVSNACNGCDYTAGIDRLSLQASGAAAAPEPASWVLYGAGVVVLVLFRQKRGAVAWFKQRPRPPHGGRV